MTETQDIPHGELVIQTLAMPADANPNGDIFGGWVLGHMGILPAASRRTSAPAAAARPSRSTR